MSAVVGELAVEPLRPMLRTAKLAAAVPRSTASHGDAELRGPQHGRGDGNGWHRQPSPGHVSYTSWMVPGQRQPASTRV